MTALTCEAAPVMSSVIAVAQVFDGKLLADAWSCWPILLAKPARMMFSPTPVMLHATETLQVEAFSTVSSAPATQIHPRILWI